jgi:hypothetical protein
VPSPGGVRLRSSEDVRGAFRAFSGQNLAIIGGHAK